MEELREVWRSAETENGEMQHTSEWCQLVQKTKRNVKVHTSANQGLKDATGATMDLNNEWWN